MLKQLAARIDREYQNPPTDGPRTTVIPDTALLKVVQPVRPKVHLNLPGLCITIQGSKVASLGDERYTFAAGTALMVGLALPVWGQVQSPSPEHPYLGFMLELKPALMREVALEVGLPPAAQGAATPGVGTALTVVDLTPEMLGCLDRMLALLDSPSTVPHLWPLLRRELVVRLLTGPQAAQLAQFASIGPPGSGIPEAIAEIRQRFRESISIAELARQSHMSVSSFHRHFLAVAKTTPLQYQKQLRLLEARQLLEDGIEGVAAAAYQVGYESPSQFSRDFARYFGYAPRETRRQLAV